MFNPDLLKRYKQSFSDYTELRAQREINRFFSYTDGKIFEMESILPNREGISARVYKNGVFGFAATAGFDDSAVKRILREADENATLLGRYSRSKGNGLVEIQNGIMPINRPFRRFTTDDFQSLLDDIACYVSRNYPAVSFSATVTDHTVEKLLAISNGFDSHNVEIYSSMNIALSRNGATEEKQQCSEEFFPLKSWDELREDMHPLYAFVDELYEKLERKLIASEQEPVDAEGGEFECILSQQFSGILAHEAVGHTMEANSLLERESIGARDMGQQVASPLVSLTDFAHTAYGEPLAVRVYVDDEGTPCKDAEIIKNGILTGMMNNRETAKIFGVDPTGNARAATYSDEPIIRMRNTCFLPGTSTLEEMISSIDRGYYLKTCGGGNGGQTGNFSLVVQEGYEIRNGRLGRPIRPTLASGSAWEALKTVDMVSRDFRADRRPGMCGKMNQSIPTISGGPEMKLRLNIGGK